MGKLVDQSPSISCLVVGTVPRYIMSVWPRILLIFLKKLYRRINVRCDGASCHIVRLWHKKVRLVTVQPLFAQSKKRKPSIIQKSHQINYDNY